MKLVQEQLTPLPAPVAEVKGYEYYNPKICERASTSELCNNQQLFELIKEKAQEYKAPLYIMLGIMSKESGFGTLWHYTNTDDCKANTYNWFGSKAKYIEGKGFRRTTYVGPGCWLQKFDSLDEGLDNLARIIGVGYKGCTSSKDYVTCMSYRYVGQPNVSEQTWVSHVNSWE